jgi:hypothetical protein
VPCGAAGEPCCAVPENGALPCARDSDCLAFGLGLTPQDGGLAARGDCLIQPGAQSGTCICQGDADCQTFYGVSSICSDEVCRPGCNSDEAGTPLACAPTAIPVGAEDCNYPNSTALTFACASPDAGA